MQTRGKSEAADVDLNQAAQEKPQKRGHKKHDPIPRMYIGPALPGLASGTVFNSADPAYLKRLMERYADLKHLIVPLEQLTACRERLRTPGTIEYRAFKTLERTE